MAQGPNLRLIGSTGSLLAFGFCFAAGIVLLVESAGDDNLFIRALGLYFVGKAFFVGPLLWITTLRMTAEPPSAGRAPDVGPA